VVNEARSESRKAICSAISSGRPKRPSGLGDALPIALNAASSLPSLSTSDWKNGTFAQIGVSTPPGAIALTLIPLGPPSFAAIRARWMTAALDAPYAAIPGSAFRPATEAVRTIAPPLLFIARIAAKEGGPSNIRVNSIAPGGVETPIWSNVPFFQALVESSGSEAAAFKSMGAASGAIGRFGRPEEIAAQIAFLLSDQAATMTGACLVSDGGYSL